MADAVCKDARQHRRLEQDIAGDSEVIGTAYFMHKLNDTSKQKYMQKRMMGGEVSGHHLHQFILGIIHKKSRIHGEKHGQITEEEYECRKQEGFSRHFCLFFLSFHIRFHKQIPHKPGQEGTRCGNEQHTGP